MQMQASPIYIDTAAAADLLGLSVDTLIRWRSDKRGPRWYRLGRLVRYKRSDLLAWVDSQASGGDDGLAK